MLNPIVNTAKNWKWINSMLTGSICMARLYYSHYDLDKHDILRTYKGCFELAIDAFNAMQLPPEGQELARQIDFERSKAFELARLVAINPTSQLAAWNATRANCHWNNATKLLARFKQEYKRTIP